MERSGEYFVNYGNKQCTGERDATATEKLGSGCWLQAETDGRTCCAELGSLVSGRLAEFQSGRGKWPHLIIRGKVHEITIIVSMVEVASRTHDPQRTIMMTNRTWFIRARKIGSKQKMFLHA